MLTRLLQFRKSVALLLFLLEVLLALTQGVIATPKVFEKPPEASGHICPTDLAAAVEEVTSRPKFKRARWGILIQTLASKRTLYAHEAKKYFIPASNVKLLTTAAALRELGSQFQIRTSVYGTGTSPSMNNLRLIGQGDPSLTTVQLKALAQQLKRQGVRRVQHLMVEGGNSSEPAINPTWEWEDVYAYYGAAVNRLILNENAVTLTLLPQQFGQPLELRWDDSIAAKQWRVDNHTITALAGASYTVEITGTLGQPVLQITGHLAQEAEPDIWGLAIPNPGRYFLQSFQSVLAAEGIRVNQVSVVPYSPLTQPKAELAAVESPPLAVLLKETNQQSNNLYAEALLRKPGNESTAGDGLDVVKQSLTELGVDPRSYVLADGSGLSRHNLVTPEAITQALQLMARTPEAEVYRSSLSVAGVNGTLKRRFQDTSTQGSLQGKTGTMSGVSALSGYLEVPSYQPLVFSIMVNQSNQSASARQEAIDEIISLLIRLRACPG
ncbi:MAG: D-alanyl-D-alanine carboxypeptidase/D-alanyl-D-alanine-endopeptidase [Cyanobacteria bacterium QH_2_48_84]|nr:MAG: D-alanyl-D-alanine carboxypeptidase/D-alanyl-D-alanine-endopeptidase [Cyanobacteria bacterium QH_2_48_84]